MAYSLIKIVHVITASLLFGVGLSNFIYFIFIHCQVSLDFRQTALKLVSFVYCWVIGVAGFFQPITGFALVYLKDYPLSYLWWLAVLGSYALAGLFWFLGLYLLLSSQVLLSDSIAKNHQLPCSYKKNIVICIVLGILAFSMLCFDYLAMAALSY